MSKPISLTFRLTFLYAFISTAVLLSLGWFISSALEKHFAEEDLAVLEGKSLLVKNIVERVEHEKELGVLKTELADAFIGHQQLSYEIATEDGNILVSSQDVKFPDSVLQRISLRATSELIEWTVEGEKYRGLVFKIRTSIPSNLVASIALETEHHSQFISEFSHTLLLFVLTAALVSGLLGWWAVHQGLTPLRVMKTRAAAVTPNRLNQRISVDSVPEELSDLANELNRMLERLENAFQRLSDFSSDLAHELRTPISNLMTQTQVALSTTRDVDTYRDVLASNSEEFERLARMISDILFLAKADHGLMLPSNETIVIEDEISNLFEFYDALAETQGVTLKYSGEGRLRGDKLMIRRAFSNLVSNALRHNVSDGYILVRIIQSSEALLISIENSGTTINAEDLPHLFERFFRGDKSRNHITTGGAGLGLAITKAIVKAHNGEISATSRQDITTFTLRFPNPVC